MDVAPVDIWSSPTTLWLGGLRQLPQALAGRPALLVADGRLEGHITSVLRAVDAVDVVTVGEDPTADPRRVLTALQTHRAAAPVALGGGSVLDLVRLAALAVIDPGADGLAAPADGVVVLPSRAVNPTVCLPTTVGTASEVSAVAVRHHSTSTALVISPALRAAAAVLDDDLTGTLPRAQLTAGLLEPLARVLVPTVTGRPLRLQDGLARALIAVLLGLGDEAATSVPDAAWRRAAAQTSAQTHVGLLSAGRDPAGHVLWPLATELARAVALPKAAVLATLLPGWLEALVDDDLGPAWGSVERVRSAVDLEPGDAAGRLRGWAAALGLPTTLPAFEVDAVTDQVLRRWAGSGLFLRGVEPAEIAAVLRRAGRH